jgi:hypothetical protein
MPGLLANTWLLKGVSAAIVMGAAWFVADDLPVAQPRSAPAPVAAPVQPASPPLMIATTPAPAPTAVSSAASAPAPILASAGGFAVRGVLAPDRPMGAGAYVWEDAGVPEGELRIIVDIAWQRLYAYRGGVEIGRAAILYGADEKPTPLGGFKILQKKKDHISNLYGASMPFMLRLTNDGIAIHGSEVEDGFATHGCIGVPDEFAALLFKEAKIGTKVLITKEWMRPTYQALDAPAEEV